MAGLPLVVFMATVGLAYILEGAAQIAWGTQPHGLKIGIPLDPLQVGGVYISKPDLVAAAVAGLLVVLLVLFFQRTRIGLGLQAIADDQLARLRLRPTRHADGSRWRDGVDHTVGGRGSHRISG